MTCTFYLFIISENLLSIKENLLSLYHNILKLIRLQYIKSLIIGGSFMAWQLPVEKFSKYIEEYVGIVDFDKKWSVFFIYVFIISIIAMIFSSLRNYKEIIILADWKDKTLNLNEIKTLKITKKISIIGLSNSGKITFINRLTHKSASQTRTQGILGKILCIDDRKLCFIDISGESLAQQMISIGLADFIILVIDHSESSKSILIKNNRISETKNLLQKIEDHIETNNLQAVIPSIVLINKQDLWAKTKKREELLREYSEIPNILSRIFKNDSELYHYSNLANKNNNSEELRKIIDHILEKLGE